MENARAPIGLIPAAGMGSRMQPYRAPKELYPFLLRSPVSPDQAVPMPVCMVSLRAIKRAGADGCVVAISDGKQEVLRDLADGADVGLPLAYVYQREPRGLPNVVTTTRPWLEGRDVVFAMPDTLFFPEDALEVLQRRRLAENADVMMGLFQAAEPERLGAVELDGAGRVVEIHDKPGHRRWPWCWGVLAWGPRFTRFCCEWEEHRLRERPQVEGVIGHVMESARRAGLAVGAHLFHGGEFLDVGTPAGLAAAVRALSRHGLLFEARG